MDMEKVKMLAGNERGSTLILALLVMVILSLLGITAMTTSSSDLMISRSQSIYNRNFALAEAAARLGALAVRQEQYYPQQDVDEVDQDEFADSECPFWMHMTLAVPDNVKASANWDALRANSIFVNGETVQFMVRYDGTSGLIEATGNQPAYPFYYTIFGRSIKDGGEVIVQMGYKLMMKREEKK